MSTIVAAVVKLTGSTPCLNRRSTLTNTVNIVMIVEARCLETHGCSKFTRERQVPPGQVETV